MPKQLQEYHRPADWETAQEILARQDLRAAPLFLSPRPQAFEDWPVDAIVDLSRLGLDTIKEESGFIKLGVLVSLQTIVESTLLKSHFHGILSECAEFSGTLGLRNHANLGGALMDQSGPCELILALLVLDAIVMVHTRQGDLKPVTLSEFIAGKTALTPGDIACEIHIASASKVTDGEALVRVARTPRDQAIVAVVTYLEMENNVASTVRVAVAGASPLPERVKQVEQLLSGHPQSPDLIEKAASLAQDWAHPVGDFRGSAEYRKAMAGTLVRRALLAVCRQFAP